jgi:CHAT domain-containing protein
VAQGLEHSGALDKLVTLRRELLALVESASSSKKSGGALALARALVPAGGAIVVPIISSMGSKLLIIAASKGGKNLSVIDLPDLTRLNEFMRGPTNAPKLGGWLGAYVINYLPYEEQNGRWPEWQSAIGNLGPELWGLLGARLDAALKERGIKSGARLVWLPTGALGILPLGLAQDPSSKRRLADDYEIVYAPSLEPLIGAQNRISKAAPTTLAAIINPTGDLPGTEKEGAIVASHFARGARTLVAGSVATPEAVLAALKGKTYWHFASHGAFDWTDARQSALLMHDQARLSVDRLLNADGLGHPRLVVLSACETGLYDIAKNADEFIGLPGAFIALGADGVVGTLWPVSDAATALLIAKFYELHLEKGLKPPAALRGAQSWLRAATTDDLVAYAKIAAAQGRLKSRHLAEINQALSADGLTRSRNSALVEWIDRAPQPGVGNTRSAANKTKSITSKVFARPYAHPYFWGGFIYTGL